MPVSKRVAAVVLTLCLMASMPLAALAVGPPVNHPAETDHGSERDDARRDVPPVIEVPSPELEGFPVNAGRPEVVPPASLEEHKPAWAGRPEWVPAPGVEKFAGASFEVTSSAEATASVEETGVARALVQIERNIDRAEDRVERGIMRHVPPGLLRALEALKTWLGFIPDQAGDAS